MAEKTYAVDYEELPDGSLVAKVVKGYRIDDKRKIITLTRAKVTIPKGAVAPSVWPQTVTYDDGIWKLEFIDED